MKTPEQRQLRRSGVFIINFEYISHLVIVFLFLTLNMQLPAALSFGNVSNIHTYDSITLPKTMSFNKQSHSP